MTSTERAISIRLSAICLVIAVGAIADAQAKVLERLSNHSQIYSERLDGAKTISVQLWISSRGTEESPATNGWRHLIEHFMAKRLDLYADENGLFLSAETGRDTMAFKFEAPPEKLSYCLEGVKRLFQPLELTPAAIELETRLIRHEEAGLNVARRFSRAGWNAVFAASRPDPVGDMKAMASATPSGLTNLQRHMMVANNLVLTVCGAVEPRTVVEAMRPFLGSVLASSELGPLPELPAAPPPTAISPLSVGSALCVKLEGIDRGSSLARIAVGFAAAQASPATYPMYSVTSREGLLTLASSNADISDQVSKMSDRQLFNGIGLLNGWLDGIGRSPTRMASFRGVLLCEGSGISLPMVKQAASPLGLAELLKAKQEILAGHKVEGFR